MRERSGGVDWCNRELKSKYDVEIIDETRKLDSLLQELRDLGIAQMIETEVGYPIPSLLFFSTKNGWRAGSTGVIFEHSARKERGEWAILPLLPTLTDKGEWETWLTIVADRDITSKKDKRNNLIAEHGCHDFPDKDWMVKSKNQRVKIEFTQERVLTIQGQQTTFSGSLDEGNKNKIEEAVKKAFKKPEIEVSEAMISCHSFYS